MNVDYILKVFFLVVISTHCYGQSAVSFFEKGYQQYDEGNYNQAIKLYDQAVALDSENASYYYYRGLCKSMLMQNEKSIADFDTAIELDPDYGEVFFERAYSYYRMDENEKSIHDYNKAIALLPDYGPAYLNRGTVKYDMDDLAGACLDWKKAVILDIEIARELLNEFCPSKS